MSRPVRCLETDKTFESLAAAGRAMGSRCAKPGVRIWMQINGRSKTAFGCRWEYADELWQAPETSQATKEAAALATDETSGVGPVPRETLAKAWERETLDLLALARDESDIAPLVDCVMRTLREGRREYDLFYYYEKVFLVAVGTLMFEMYHERHPERVTFRTMNRLLMDAHAGEAGRGRALDPVFEAWHAGRVGEGASWAAEWLGPASEPHPGSWACMLYLDGFGTQADDMVRTIMMYGRADVIRVVRRDWSAWRLGAHWREWLREAGGGEGLVRRVDAAWRAWHNRREGVRGEEGRDRALHRLREMTGQEAYDDE